MNEDTVCVSPPSKKQKVMEVDEAGPSEVNQAPEVENPGNTVRDNHDDYGNFIRPEEVDRLKEFHVLDEVKSNDEDSNDDESNSDDDKSVGVPEEEIEKMLDEDLPDNFKAPPKPKEKPYITREKIILEEKGINYFEVLPLDWTTVRHCSGMPVYLHRPTRVCTLAKPYFLGKGNTRRHDIPITSIPCLAYRTALKEEEKQKEIDRKIQEQIKNGTWLQSTHPPQSNNQTNVIKTEENVNGKNEAYVNSTEVKEEADEIIATIGCPFRKRSEATEKDVINVTNDENVVTDNLVGKATNEEISQVTNKETNEAMDQAINIETNNQATNMETNEAINEVTNEATKKDANEAMDQSTNMETSESKDEATNKETNGPADKETSEAAKINDIEIPLSRKPVVLPGGIVMTPPRVETVNTSWKSQHLTHDQINEYCSKLFKFKTVNVMHFRRWEDRRKYTKVRKALQFPALPAGTKLITIPAQASPGDAGKVNKRDWVMNMNGRSYLSVFHEYVRRALQKQPVYEFKQLENAATPYQATVFIGGMQYGVGSGTSKRAAKAAAARASIQVLIPELGEPPAPTESADNHFFDQVGIEDPRITELCAAACEPAPHAILRTCLVRNFGAGDRHIQTEIKKLEYQKIELTMRVGKHSATVVCKNKKQAKQKASQAVLQALHPHVRSWGSLLRLYGARSVKSCKQRKLEEQQITLLQDHARRDRPNIAVLDKLRSEMMKLRARDEAVVPIGTLLVKDDLPEHSGSNLNNVDL